MRIAIVNDLRLACEALRRAVVSGKHQVAWIAYGGQEAIEAAQRDRPDLILMDMLMPGVDGVEATRRIMQVAPCPILVVTATVSGNVHKVFDALGHGALDAVNTPTLGPQGDLQGAVDLLAKIAQIEHLNDRHSLGPASPKAAKSTLRPVSTRLVLLGASTGGPSVLATILAQFPRDISAAIIIAQHVDDGFTTNLAQWLQEKTTLRVQVASNGTEPRAGQVYVASAKHHLIVRGDGRLYDTEEPRQGWYKPSVDVLFASAAQHWPASGAAALLTGMGRDGAAGMCELRRAGWLTIAQDQATSIVWGMPRAAVELGAAQLVLPADRIAAAIVASLRGG